MLHFCITHMNKRLCIISVWKGSKTSGWIAVCSCDIQGGSHQHSKWCASIQLKSSWQHPVSCSNNLVQHEGKTMYKTVRKTSTKCKVAIVTPQRSDVFLSLCFLYFSLCIFSQISFCSFSKWYKCWGNCFCVIKGNSKKLPKTAINSWCIWINYSGVFVSSLRHGVMGSLVT